MPNYAQSPMNHIIRPDDRHAVRLGFTADKFDGWLWKDENTIFLSLVISKSPRKGNLKELVDNILALGYTVKIPSPIGAMRKYVHKYGFIPMIEADPNFGRVQVWIKTPSGSQINQNP